MVAARPHIGWIGLGTMGQAMAPRLLQAGYELTVWNRTPGKAEALKAAGAHVALSPQAVACDADVIITMVSGPEDARAVCVGDQGVLHGMSMGKTLIDMSTIGPVASKAIAGAAAEIGVHALDAPVSGSQQPAMEGQLVIMVGGAEDTFERCKPIFSVLGKQSVYAGDHGMGSAMKLVINLMLAHLMANLCEATVFAERLGLHMEDIIDIAADGPLQTPWMRRQGGRVMARDFAPNFSLKHMRKDITLAMELATTIGVPLKVSDAIQWLYDEAAKQGHDELNYSAIFHTVAQAA